MLCLSRWSVWIVLPLTAVILFAMIKMTGDRQCWLWLTLPIFCLLGFLCCEREREQESYHLSFIEGENPVDTEEWVTVTGLVRKMTEQEFGKDYLLEDVVLWRGEMSADYVGDSLGGDEVNLQRMLVRLSTGFMAVEGDRIWVKGSLTTFEGATNPGQFDYREYQSGRGIYLLLKGDDGGVLAGGERPLLTRLAACRRYLVKCLVETGGTEGGTMAALVLGDKTYLPDERKTLYMDSGIGHVLTLSGLHLSLLGVGLYGILRRRLTLPQWPAAVLIAVGICAYVSMIGGGISAMRAAIALVISLLAGCVGKTYDSPSAAALGMLLILGEYPRQISNPSFWLSFGAVFAMGGLLPLLRDWLDPGGKRKKWVNLILPCVVIQLALMPVTALNQYTLQTYSVLLNLLVLPLMGILLGGSIGVLCVGLICPKLAGYPGYLVGSLFNLMDKLCNISLGLPGSVISVGNPTAGRLLLYGMVLGGFSIGVYRRNRLDWEAQERPEGKNRWVVLAVVWVVLGLILWVKPGSSQLVMAFLDVGQGDCIFMEMPSGTTVMVDCGSSSRTNPGTAVAVPFLQWSGVDNLDYLVLTHLDEDHVNGVEALLSSGVEVETLLISSATTETDKVESLYTKMVGLAGEVVYISEKDRIQCGKVEIICLYPKGGTDVDSENEASVVLQVNYGDFSCLLTGDLEGNGEKHLTEILKEIKKQGDPGITLLKVAHHGSKYATSEELLEVIAPRAAVISCGKNNRYGHPHGEVLERLTNMDCDIYSTAKSGAVMVQTDGKRWKLYGWSDEQKD